MNKCWAMRLLALLLLSVNGLSASQLDQLDGALQVHGFLTQAYVKTTENSFFGDSQDGSWDFRELGINSSYRFTPSTMASVQLLSRRAGEMYDGSLDLDYAQLDSTIYTADANRVGIIVGRYKNPFGLYNDTRDVAATRPGIFMPQAIYWDRVRNMVLSNDGAQLFGDMQVDEHRFSIRLIGGKTPIDENVEKSYLNPLVDPEMEQDGLTLGGRLLYEWDGGRFNLAYSSAQLTLDAETSMLPDGEIEIDYRVLSAQYNSGSWSLTLEYMQEPLNYSGFGGVMDAGDTTLDGYYLQGTYRLWDDLELFARYEESHYDKEDKRGKKTAQRLGLEAHNFYSRVSTLGLLWEVTEGLIVRSEFSQVDGTIFLSNLENPPPNERSRNWNLFSLLVSYSF
ncbi:MAG: hypothetical protein ABW130_02675 [Candidatus Thiodiazotropha lotti]|nr:hypothetical protein [Candidatus Thiodiazotropha lotti]MCW4206930.1 hypothetical protein [Candidatus Thiodiazotropha lotti]MCW4211414.1 hypothetical protein [Candidatus Thiodiazotropha lotti]